MFYDQNQYKIMFGFIRKGLMGLLEKDWWVY